MGTNDADGREDKAVLRRHAQVLLTVPVGNAHLVLKRRQHHRGLVKPGLPPRDNSRQRFGQRGGVGAKTEDAKRRGRRVYVFGRFGRCLIDLERRAGAPGEPSPQTLLATRALGRAGSVVVQLLGLVERARYWNPSGRADVGHRFRACHRGRHQLSGLVMLSKLHQRQLTLVRRVDRQLEQRLGDRRRWFVRCRLLRGSAKRLARARSPRSSRCSEPKRKDMSTRPQI